MLARWIFKLLAASVLCLGVAGAAAAATPNASAKKTAPPDVDVDEGDRLFKRGHYEKAMAWWKEASEKGSANALYRIGEKYRDGVMRDKDVIVKRDFAEAAKWLTRAAELGDERAHFDLGGLYDDGLGVEQSVEQAARWYLAGAERGQMACQYNIAVMYEEGTGVAKDPVAAYKWYYLAAQQGFIEFGGPALEKLSRAMSPEQVRDAIDMARNFVTKPIVR